MVSHVWRFFVALTDWRYWLKKLSGKPILDVVFISNMRDTVDRKRFLGKWRPSAGHFNGPRYKLKNVAGLNRALDCIAEDLLTSQGRKKAKEQFISATNWAQDKGACVVLLAASTKRLFGEYGQSLRELFPNMLFTIGDNGTMLLLLEDTLRAFKQAELNPEHCRIAILGPYGFLGELMVRSLKKEGYKVIGAGPNIAGLKKVSDDYGIEICQSFDDMGKVDAVVACTHSEKISLKVDSVDLIRRNNKKLLVIDVAEPSNLRQDEYEKCKDVVIRQDAGNAFSPSLKYVLGALSYRMFRLTRGVTFGCFSESLCLASALKRGEYIGNIDWFTVNDTSMATVKRLFDHEGFTIPSPRCFGKKVKSFNLELK